MHIHVVGAGVIGLCSAVALQREGFEVTVLDPLPPPGGASFGNAGLVSSDSFLPQAQPGMLRQIPKWLRDPMGPLALSPSYAATILPWLIRWVLAGRRTNVERIAPAMLDLHRRTFDLWQALLGDNQAAILFRRQGQAYAWEVPVGKERSALPARLREQLGLRSEWLDGAAMRDLFPGLSDRVKGGLLLPDNGQLMNPGDVVQALAGVFLSGGGTILHERVTQIVPSTPQGGEGALIVTNCANHRAGTVVLAAGAWTNGLLAPLGVRLPIAAERGYHAHLPTPSIELPMPISMRSRGFAATSMSDGLRAAGTVEITHMDAPMNMPRATRLLDHIGQLFPGVTHGEPRFWMGVRPSTPDSLPIIDALPGLPGIFVCAGHGHTGMIGGPGSAEVLVGLMRARRDRTELPRTRYGYGRFRGIGSFFGPRFA